MKKTLSAAEVSEKWWITRMCLNFNFAGNVEIKPTNEGKDMIEIEIVERTEQYVKIRYYEDHRKEYRLA